MSGAGPAAPSLALREGRRVKPPGRGRAVRQSFPEARGRARDRAGRGGRETLITSLPLLLAIGNFAVGFGAFVAIGVLTPIGSAFAVSADVAGRVMTAYAAAYAVGSPVLVAFTGRLGRRTALGIGLALFLVGMVASTLAPSFEALVAARIVAALGAGIYTPSAAAVAVAVSPPERRGRALSLAFSGLTLAQVLGIPIGAWLGYAAGWQATFALGAGFAGLALVTVLPFVPGDLRAAPTSLAALGRALRRPRLIFAVLLTASYLGAIYVIYTFFALLLETRLGLGRDGVTAFLFLFGAAAVVGNLVGGALADRIGPSRTLLAGAAMLVAVHALLPLPLWGTAAMAVLVVLWSLAGWGFMAPQQTRLVRLAPAEAALVLALNASSIYVGVALGSAVGGVVLAAGGLTALAVGGALAALWTVAHLLWSDRLAGVSTLRS